MLTSALTVLTAGAPEGDTARLRMVFRSAVFQTQEMQAKFIRIASLVLEGKTAEEQVAQVKSETAVRNEPAPPT